MENRDGTYDLYEAPKVAVENMDDAFKSKNQTPIRPFELKTFLKVGEWPPNSVGEGEMLVALLDFFTWE